MLTFHITCDVGLFVIMNKAILAAKNSTKENRCTNVLLNRR